MIELDFIFENVQNPVVRAFIIAMGYQAVVSRAKEINIVQRLKGVNKAEREHHRRVKKFTSSKLSLLLQDIWKMTRELPNTMNTFEDEKGRSKVIIRQGHKTMEHFTSEYIRDYWEEARKNLFEVKRKQIIEDFYSKANTMNYQLRDEYIDGYAQDFRRHLLGAIHKTAGYNEQVENTEDEYILYTDLRKMFSFILTEVESSINIKEAEEKKYKKDYSVNTFNVLKIIKSIFQRRKI